MIPESGPTIDLPSHRFYFPWWLLWLLGSVLASVPLTGIVLGLFFRVVWYRAFNETGWRMRLWLFRRTKKQ